LLTLAACDTKTKEQLTTLAHSDSLRTDSLVAIKNELLNEVMTSTQFVNDINGQLAKVRRLQAKRPVVQVSGETEKSEVKAQEEAIVQNLHTVIARLDAAEARMSTLRHRAAALSSQDSSLMGQVAEYEKTIADLKTTILQQKADYQAIIDKQTAQILVLNNTVDTLTHKSVALADTVSQLTTEKNTAYYVVGTKDELVKKGILVEEGKKRFLVFGGRHVEPARELDTTVFTRIDRLRDRNITLPDGEYQILTRQNPAYAAPVAVKDGKITGGITISQPEQFWQSSRFLILLKS